MTKCVCQHKVIKGGKLQKSESSLVCVIIAEGSTNVLPVSTNIPADFCIPVSLYNKNPINISAYIVSDFKYLQHWWSAILMIVRKMH